MQRRSGTWFSSLALFFLLALPARGAGTLFLDRCVGNCTYSGSAFDNACTNVSTVLTGTRILSAYSGTDGDWSELLACVRSVLDPFDVTVTDVNPGCANQWEIPVAGTPDQAGYPDGTQGVASFDCDDSPNNIAFVFGNHPGHAFVPNLCWTVVHEFAHLIGLEHEGLSQDPMSYVEDCRVKRFSPVASPCGTGPGDVQACVCTGVPQSSFTMLTQRLGKAPGLIFSDAFEKVEVDDTLGSSCHWDEILGEEEPPPFADSASVAHICATDFSKVRRTPPTVALSR